MSKSVLFQVIHFSISTQFSSFWIIGKTLSDATIPSLSESGSDGNKGELHIPQISSITRSSPSDSWVLYRGHFLGES